MTSGIPLELKLAEIPGVAQKFQKYLTRLGIESVRNLLWHFPSRYEDFSQIRKIADLAPGEQATIQAEIEEINFRRTWKRHMTIVEALLADDSGNIKAIWFNQPYIVNTLRVGRSANFAGKVSVSDENEVYLSHPAYELMSGRPGAAKQQETRHTARLVPIYPETRGLTSKGLRFLIQPILRSMEHLDDWIPAEILRNERLPDVNRALAVIHFPQKIEDALAARRRFAFEDLFLLQLVNLEQKLKLAQEKAPAISINIEKLKKILAGLPFELTLSQKKSLWEIIQDMGPVRKPHSGSDTSFSATAGGSDSAYSPSTPSSSAAAPRDENLASRHRKRVSGQIPERISPMNRLLQGDVGSGKTVVAALAALGTAESGFQTAFMVPTEILAHQHFATIKKLFGEVATKNQTPVALLTSASATIFYENDVEFNVKKTELTAKIAAGEIKIIIGTHALIAAAGDGERVEFKNLGLVIVDEQHRFGVRQRQELARRSELVPHFLSMSATPIPRTLMLTVFGDLDISTITELPAGRKNIATKIVPLEERAKTYDFIRSEVKSGRQTFVICPRVKPSEENGTAKYQEFKKLELKSVKEEYEKLSKKIFPDLKVAMLHGQMKSGDKERLMKDFARGKIDVLVSTSVVEVGVDVPNATIMMIEGSDRFGLAQLYQFRGRVGRGEHQSYCFLFTDSRGGTVKERLKAIIEAKNGFELAERDLKIRGPGEFLGETQSGMPDVAMNALTDAELVKSSREAAKKMIAADSGLRKYPLLRKKIEDFRKSLHLE